MKDESDHVRRDYGHDEAENYNMDTIIMSYDTILKRIKRGKMLQAANYIRHDRVMQ